MHNRPRDINKKVVSKLLETFYSRNALRFVTVLDTVSGPGHLKPGAITLRFPIINASGCHGPCVV